MTLFDLNNIEATEIIPNLWVGSKPTIGMNVAENGFTHLFLCADSAQFPVTDFPCVEVFHCPYEDNDTIMDNTTMSLVVMTAKMAAEVHKNGGKVLITCVAGRNRSALVAALALRILGKPPVIAVEMIKANRNQNCLTNTCFLRIALGINKQVEFFIK